MLHMATITHGPDTCAAVHPDVGEKARKGIANMDEVAKKHSATVEGMWGDPPAHLFWLVDAPNAHAVSEILIELEYFHWNTVEVRPVRTVDEAVPLAARA